ncbi:hypothetical protein ACFO26_05955 [Lactococcus nasutitermitis]|uniref:Uncharacterized protein n=1 Tax=Lactococcus nasutitermitis TaxID=1652957 RepID=A0ABV9JEU2_9LACT|nr:hypothetical protein [Lactococcus nasutitermitis]
MSDEWIVSLGSKIFFQLSYVGLTIYYLFRLNDLNNQLKNNVDVSDPFNVVTYNGEAAIWFTVEALILVAIAIGLTIWYFKTASNTEGWQFGVLALVSAILNLAAIFFIWNFINNPILRAVIIVLVAGAVTLAALNNK